MGTESNGIGPRTSRDGHIIRNSEDFLSSSPDRASIIETLRRAVEAHIDGHIEAGNLPAE